MATHFIIIYFSENPENPDFSMKGTEKTKAGEKRPPRIDFLLFNCFHQ
jgi:hypothetical protein